MLRLAAALAVLLTITTLTTLALARSPLTPICCSVRIYEMGYPPTHWERYNADQLPALMIALGKPNRAAAGRHWRIWWYADKHVLIYGNVRRMPRWVYVLPA